MPKVGEEVAEKASPAAAPPKTIPMSSGYELNGATALPITRSGLARVIVLAGPVGSGKTSLLAALFDLFGKGRIRPYAFAGSETLPVFERRCHPSRIASERAQSDMERTKLDEELKLLHLRVHSIAGGKKTDVLMSDPSGEAFLLARDSTDECRKLAIVRRADVFVLCLDGGGLAKRRTRAGIVTDARTLLRSMLDADMLGGSSHVQVLFTKADQLRNPEGQTEAELRSSITEEFQRHFAARLRRLDFLKTSVVPLNTAEGVEELLGTWVERDDLAPAGIIEPSYRSARLYDQFNLSELNGRQ